MALNARQKRFYVYTVDIWRQTDPVVTADNQVTDRGHYVRVATNVKCLYESTPDFDQMTELGLVKETNLFTTDLYHFSCDVDITATDFLYSVGGNFTDGLMGRWWSVLGISQVHNTLGMTNKQRVYANINDAPAGAEDFYISSLSTPDASVSDHVSDKWIPSDAPHAVYTRESW